MLSKIGFWQGLFSPIIDSFDYWDQEIQHARSYDFPVIEWVLSQERLSENPIMTVQGRRRIAAVTARTGVRIDSIYLSCFMQFPFWKCDGVLKNTLIGQMKTVIRFAGELQIKKIVVPLISNGAIENKKQEDRVLKDFFDLERSLQSSCVDLCLESSYSPEYLAPFISRLSSRFGISYNTSASVLPGRNPLKDIEAYGQRIMNVHIADRNAQGAKTLGEGDVDFQLVISKLRSIGYAGNYILKSHRRENYVESAIQDRAILAGWLTAE